jgi:predicted ABC-type sugar transport system permease subunit
MNEAVRATMRVVVSTAGGVLAGPAGVLAGTLVGGLLTAVLPGGSALVETLAKELAKKGVELASTHLTDRGKTNHQPRFADRLQGCPAGGLV